MSAGVDTGDVNEFVYRHILKILEMLVDFSLIFLIPPNYLDVTGFSTTDRSDGFTVDFNELESGLTE
ncbi:MAG: hypothetical protein CM15mP4_2830 [Candidatus Neomarinimicrobiota bacterium]|nr:MAG: hypothetical protein CM15mP4_2830 [Candidatus Neomarinimicrobiota bacterium]